MQKTFAISLIAMLALLPIGLSLCYASDIYDKTKLASGGDSAKTIPSGTTGFASVKDAYTQTAYSKDAYLYPAYSYTPKTYGSTANADTAWDLKMSYLNNGPVATQYTPISGNVSGNIKNTAIVNIVPSLAKLTTLSNAAPSFKLHKTQKSENIEKTSLNILMGSAKKPAAQATFSIAAETNTNKSVKYNKGSPQESFYGTFKELKTDKHAHTRNKLNPESHAKTTKKAAYAARGYTAIHDAAEPALEMPKMRIGTIRTNLANKAEQLKNAVSGLIPIMKNSCIDSSAVIHAAEDLNIILPPVAEPATSAEPMESQASEKRNRTHINGNIKHGALVPAQNDMQALAKHAAMVHLSILSIDKANNYHKTGLSPPDDSPTLPSATSLSRGTLPVFSVFFNPSYQILHTTNRIIQHPQHIILSTFNEFKGRFLRAHRHCNAFISIELHIVEGLTSTTEGLGSAGGILRLQSKVNNKQHNKGGTNETS
jgi:hypothetical protein